MDFKVDENLPIEVLQLLRDAGHDASAVLDEGMGGASDDKVAETSRQEARVLITLDRGFADIRRYPPSSYPGIIVLRLRRQDKSHVLQIVGRVIATLAGEPVEKRLWIAEERRVRIRA